MGTTFVLPPSSSSAGSSSLPGSSPFAGSSSLPDSSPFAGFFVLAGLFALHRLFRRNGLFACVPEWSLCLRRGWCCQPARDRFHFRKEAFPLPGRSPRLQRRSRSPGAGRTSCILPSAARSDSSFSYSPPVFTYLSLVVGQFWEKMYGFFVPEQGFLRIGIAILLCFGIFIPLCCFHSTRYRGIFP